MYTLCNGKNVCYALVLFTKKYWFNNQFVVLQ